MSSNTPSTSFFPTSKRSACDRCREQKLRCPARENGTQSCIRCVRAGLQCVTGYTKPLGRSVREKTSSKVDVQPATVPTVDMALNRPASMDLAPPTTTTMESTSLTADETSASQWRLFEGSESDHLLAQDCCPTPAQEDASNSSSLSDALFLSNALHPGNNMNERDVSLFEDSVVLSSMHFPSGLVAAGRMAYSDSIMEDAQQQQQQQQQPLPPPPPPTPPTPSGRLGSVLSGADCDLRLSQLSVDLCTQMQLCMTDSQRWDTTTMDPKVSGGPFSVMGKGPDDQSNSNAFGDALCSTSEFLAILQSYGCAGAGWSSAGSDHRHNTTSRSSIGFVCMLNLLSSYLRIIAIFDSLYLRLYELLCCSITSSPGSSAGAGLQIFPGLQLAGFSVQHGSFQAKILIQVTQHQFEMIEKILGLPAEFRVSDRRDVYPAGLLGDGWARSLLQAVINGHHDEEGATKLPFDWDSAVGSLGSLRMNVMKLRQLLDIQNKE